MLSRAETRRIEALQRRKGRAREGLFTAEGLRVVEDLLASDLVLHSVVASPSIEDSDRGRALLEAVARRTQLLRATDAELRRLAGTETPQGILAVAHMPVRTLDDIALPERAVVLVLDGVQDPGNLGTLVRAADAFAAPGVIALPGTVDCWNPKVVRAAAGSLFRAPVVYVSSADAGAWLDANRCGVYAAEVIGEDVDALEAEARTALLLGNEGAGLSDAARALAHRSVAIRMPGRAESLNVAVAAGILLYAFTRRMS